jgi:exoribonuclease-2
MRAHEVDRYSPRPPTTDLRFIARKAMEKYGLEPRFPPVAIAKAEALKDISEASEGLGIRDMRHLLWSSIDNFDTQDIDQLEYCERGQGGEILVKVAIADVDAYVPKGSILDMHAQANTTSVYTGVDIFPMLPDHLSKNLTSLMIGQTRLAMVVEFAVLPRGNIRPGKIYRAIVKNKAKLVYEEVGAWLDGSNPQKRDRKSGASAEAADGQGPQLEILEEMPELEAQLRLQDEASIRLGNQRAGMGALELETLETRAVVEDDKVLELYVVEDGRAKRIIENFMIGANGTISSFLEKMNVPMIHRVVRVPKYWGEIVGVADAKGFRLPSEPNALALSKFLEKQKQEDPERFPDLSLAIVKLLGPGEYVMFDRKNPVGHFCLAVTSYTHGTAPNRRYVDLVIQRLLKAALKPAATPYKRDELSEMAEWCTDRERAAKKVERFVTKAEGAVLLSDRLGKIFDAIVTGASDKGIYARLLDPPVEGKVTSQGRNLHVGQKVKVKLINLDPAQGFVDLEVFSR